MYNLSNEMKNKIDDVWKTRTHTCIHLQLGTYDKVIYMLDRLPDTQAPSQKRAGRTLTPTVFHSAKIET